MAHKLLTVAMVTCTSALLAISANAAAHNWHVIGRASASGDFAVAAANGTAKHPTQIAVKIVSSHGGTVSGMVVVACSKGFGIGSKSSQLSGRSPLQRIVKLPMRGADSCDVTASGSSMAGGRLSIQILAR